MSNYKKHFDRELKIMKDNLKKGDSLAIKDFIPDIESIIEKFSKQGHSGGSAPFYAGALSSVIKKTLLFHPLSPLAGKDDEWNNDISQDDTCQNNRERAVFKKGKNGRAYFLNAIVWVGEDRGNAFTGSVEGIDSRQFIKSFPFTPKTFYVDVVRGEPDYVIKNKKQLEEVFRYYSK